MGERLPMSLVGGLRGKVTCSLRHGGLLEGVYKQAIATIPNT